VSREHLEIAKRCVDAFDRRDLDELAETVTADYEWVGAFLGTVEGGSYRGREGMARYFAEAEQTWESFSVTGEEFRDLDDRVLVLGRMEGRGRSSGVEVDTPYTMIVEFHEGKVSRSRAYLDHAEALRAAGLSAAPDPVESIRREAMSRENVEIVRRIYEEITVRREFPAEWFDPACISDFTDVAPEGSLHRGVEATNEAIAGYFATFEDFHVAVEQIVYADHERVIAAIRDGGRIRDSGTEITSRYFHAWAFRNGKVVRLSSHTDEAAGVKAGEPAR
jgi:ketosteroid isomerase-like protein